MTLRLRNPVLLLYLLFTYALPAWVNWFTGYESALYVNPDSGLGSWLYAALLFTIVVAFAFRIEYRQSAAAQPPAAPTPRLPVRPVFTLLALVLIVALAGAAMGLSRWRYAEDGLSSALGPTTVLYVLAPSLLEILLFALVFFRYHAKPLHRQLALLLVAACMALTASGIGPMFAALLAVIATLAPDTLRSLLFRADAAAHGRVRRLRVSRLLVFAAVSVVLAAGAYVVGDAIKTNTDLGTVVQALGDDGSDIFVNYLIGRLSVHWYSLVAALHQFVDADLGGQLGNLMAPIGNAWFRFTALTGGWLPAERPLDGSLARLNYNLINLYPFNDREGSSPGLLASFVIAFPTWLAPWALTGYLWLYNAVQKRLRQRMLGQPTWLGEVVLLYFTAVFFASPVDFLLVFDPMVFTVLVWAGMGFGQRSIGKRQHHARHAG